VASRTSPPAGRARSPTHWRTCAGAIKVEITALAEADLETIYQYIQDDSPTRAAEWRRGLLQAAQALEQWPHRCPLAPESGAGLEIRQLLHGRYRVLFTVTRETVYILHIRHAARRQLTAGAIDDAKENEIS
jgi:plasmid stabilization system protein ParE